jgi:hypothetical protein
VQNINGVIYGFEGPTSAIVTLNVANGQTSVVAGTDPALGLIEGAAPAAVPEPSCLALAGFGIAALIVFRAKQALATGKRSV